MDKEPDGKIYQFRIELLDIEPPIWRQIQVPADYSFCDLHVALQDAMGWLDYHLHAFYVKTSNTSREKKIGIPIEDGIDRVLPGWEAPLGGLFDRPGSEALYNYDFGDGWNHAVVLEDVLLREKGVQYPRCIAGERACPPEDCGGVWGYQDLLETLNDPEDPEYEDIIEWLKGQAPDNCPFDPERFDPDQVTFDNPEKRFEKAFG